MRKSSDFSLSARESRRKAIKRLAIKHLCIQELSSRDCSDLARLATQSAKAEAAEVFTLIEL